MKPPRRPYANLIENYNPGKENIYYAERYIEELFTETETKQLKAYLDRQHGEEGTTTIEEVQSSWRTLSRMVLSMRQVKTFKQPGRSDPKVFELWESLTPLGRNEFICWVDDAKQPATRQRRIARTCDELLDGKKRPCCWAGCIHRTDKAPSRWQQAVLIDRRGKNGS